MADAAHDIPRMSAAEYLERERDGSCRHEFVDGLVYSMAGGTRRHNDIALQSEGELNSRLASPCRSYAIDVKVHIKASEKEVFYYPDVVATCSDLDDDDYLIKFPSLIIEVLSKTTENADRGYKFDDYRRLASLQEYVLVHQERPCVEIYRRRTGWQKEIFEPDAAVVLECVHITVPLGAFYRRVTF